MPAYEFSFRGHGQMTFVVGEQAAPVVILQTVDLLGYSRLRNMQHLGSGAVIQGLA